MRSSPRKALLVFAPALLAACASDPDKHTLAELHGVEPDMTEVRVEQGLDQAIQGYAKYLEVAPKSSLTPEAMRRLADLKLEKEFGLLGDGEIRELPAPEATPAAAPAPARAKGAAPQKPSESDAHFEKRATEPDALAAAQGRSESDRGVLVLCDPRLMSKTYGKVFLDSLPPLPKTRRVDDVVAFFAPGSASLESTPAPPPETDHE